MSPMNWERVEIDGQSQELLVMKSTEATVKKIEARPGDVLRLGSMVLWHGVHWLVTTLDADDQVQFAGTMTQCNTVLRWQGADQSICVAYAVAEDATKYGTGVSDNTLMRIGEFALKLKVQMNESTLQIRRDQRFLIGEFGTQFLPNAYITSRLNQVTGTYLEVEDEVHKNYGYIEITLLEDQYRPNADRADLMVADYVPPNDNNISSDDEDMGAFEGGVDW